MAHGDECYKNKFSHVLRGHFELVCFVIYYIRTSILIRKLKSVIESAGGKIENSFTSSRTRKSTTMDLVSNDGQYHLRIPKMHLAWRPIYRYSYSVCDCATGFGNFRKKRVSSRKNGRNWKKGISSSFFRKKVEKKKKLEESGRNWKKYMKLNIYVNKLVEIIFHKFQILLSNTGTSM